MEVEDINLLALSQQARANLKYDEVLDPDSDHFVELNSIRGDFSEEKFLWKLGIANENAPLEESLDRQYILFGGHRGCGKSTELRRLANALDRPNRYMTIFVDALSELDINNLSYSDILLAQAKVLIDKLKSKNINVDAVFLTLLENWFKEHIEKNEKMREFAMQIRAGAKVSSGIPFLGKIFTGLTNSARINSTYKTEIRNIVRNTFTEFAEVFNALLLHVQEKIAETNQGQNIIFIVDGTDRLRGEDAENFFIHDVHQLKLINTNIIYCAPIHLLTERSESQQNFSILRLPMIKLAGKGLDEFDDDVMQQLRQLVDVRMARELFDDENTLDYMIKNSGGHLRDLIRLLNYALAETRGRSKITQGVAEVAVRQLAVEYRRLIQQDDYALLVDIDTKDAGHTPVNDNTRRLLYDLVLLEYNSYWWQSHPVVKTLPGYQQALADAT